MPIIVGDSCIGCQSCISNCPVGALEMNGEDKLTVNAEKCIDCGKCISICPVSALNNPDNKKNNKIVLQERSSLKSPIKSCDNTEGIWVFAEQLEGELASVTLELIGESKKLASKLNVIVSAVLFGDKVENLVSVLFEYGADKVYLVDNPVFHFYRAETYSKAFCYLIDKYKPEILLIGATTTGRDLAGAVATSMKTGLTADCTKLDIDLEKGILLASRPAFGGNIMATIVCKDRRPQMATVRPRVMKMPEPKLDRRGFIIREKFTIDESSLRTKVLEIVRQKSEDVRLEDAKIIVCGGRGVQNEEGFMLLEKLARVLGGVVAGSRGAVDKGLIDYRHQVGQTGQTVSPKLYFAIGISGAVQHVIGMQGAETIVAVNTDKECPMMKLATYSIAGDLFEVLPKMIESFKQVLSDSYEINANSLHNRIKGAGKID
ncbi:MAG: electron transfer flavoprotein subunit alpha [Clostridium sp.]|jgi:electron transfer flavoprotein alpha subunit|uniref:electron transfer flavoprotein subunit alpha n=1 Tax=Clostridium sp. TaxID=1506 RepID=UPI0025C6FEBD|nr:electron transfer flavoprotein subunit alpha [Clostridium sp.]MCH3962722.1 electron transfer flavoprotein subunit alpha [Clostridium sp.]MCI1715863.1 electron transfer flavoprotein subunit alpha [Clostridium sp.]MCI1799932.1 electron transfer flavoprotein subunit alpha [Clostridium sp.]MCI1813846.1 electron transfer flavoprotein subunit alpha [Clostridium sp.]MCI1870744.1 electron transfer flavoprotein subunit alpha [Clostridium sp.]